MRIPPREYFRIRVRVYAPALGVFLLGILLSSVLSWWLFEDARRIDAERFDAAVQNLTTHLEERSKRYTLELERFTDQVASLPNVTRQAWQIAHDRLGPKYKLPAVVELAYVENTGLKSLGEVKELAQKPRRASTGALLLQKIEWRQQKVTRQWTFNLCAGPEETGAWLMAPEMNEHWKQILNGKLTSSPKRVLTDENGIDFAAVSFLFPIFESDVSEISSEFPYIRHTQFLDHRYKAMVIATINWQTFLETSLSGDMARLGLEAFSDTSLVASNWMGSGGAAASKVLDPRFKPRHSKTVEWPFFRRRWQLVFYSTPLFESLSTAFRGWGVLAGGAGLSLLMTGLVGVQIRARRRQERVSARLKTALDALSAARNERQRLNHDLHDGTIQSLYALQLGLSRSVEIAADFSTGLGTRIDDHRRAVSGVIGELRRFILRHEARSGPAGDLATVLEALIQRLRLSTEKVLKTELSPHAARSLASEQAVHLANFAREALSNALRHANASTIIVRLTANDSTLALEVIDDGAGFDLSAPSDHGLGLTSMSARAQQAGGTLEIDSKPAGGTRLRVIVPQAKTKESAP